MENTLSWWLGLDDKYKAPIPEDGNFDADRESRGMTEDEYLNWIFGIVSDAAKGDPGEGEEDGQS